MGIRETINKNPAITTGATIAIVVLALGAIVWQLYGGPGSGARSAVGKQFYTDDDGATYFVDDAKKIPPFDHHGKQAVIARVYRCGENGTPFVAILQRYTKETKARLEKQAAGGAKDTVIDDLFITGVEVKKPKTGDAGWVGNMDPKAAAINRVTCPDGKTESLQVVTPD